MLGRAAANLYAGPGSDSGRPQGSKDSDGWVSPSFRHSLLRARTDCRWIHRHIMAWLSLLIQFQSIDSMVLSNHEFTSTSTRQLELRQSRCIPSLSLWSESGLWSIKNSLGISRSPARQRMTRPAPSLLARRACWAAVATLRSRKLKYLWFDFEYLFYNKSSVLRLCHSSHSTSVQVFRYHHAE